MNFLPPRTGFRMVLLLVLLCLLCRTSWTVSQGGMDAINVLGPEELGEELHLKSFLFNRSSGILYIGGRNVIFSVDTNNLNQKSQQVVWEAPEESRMTCMRKGRTEVECHNYVLVMEFLGDGRVFVCGTNAFNPQCAFLDESNFTLERTEEGKVKTESGMNKCPYNPEAMFTALMADGHLYMAGPVDFQGSKSGIFKTKGSWRQSIDIRSPLEQLKDPDFVGTFHIEQHPHDPTGEDGKIYFFFNEESTECNDRSNRVRVTRVARVCKSDVGGLRTLRRSWTTFLKFGLFCRDKLSGQHFNVLKDVFSVQHTPGDIESTHFYGLFTSQWQSESLTAMCFFSLSDINKVFEGPFKGSELWKLIPTPRPGKCLDNELRALGFTSSLTLPDHVLTFIKKDFLMESLTAAPVLVRKGVAYTKLVVSRPGDDRQGILLHLGTDRGEVHQVAVMGHNATLLQEVRVFPSPEPVNNIFLHEGWAVVSSPGFVARVQAEGCDLYLSCEVCAGATGLGCVWNTTDNACTKAPSAAAPGDEVDEALKRCNRGKGRCDPEVKEMRVTESLRLLLPCVQLSSWTCIWQHPHHPQTRQQGSDLELTTSEEAMGLYICTCQEGKPGSDSTTDCRRAAYNLTLDGTCSGSEEPLGTGGHHVLAVNILLFCGGFAFGGIFLFFMIHWSSVVRRCRHLQERCKRRDFPGPGPTSQSPRRAGPLSEVSPLKEKRDGTATAMKPAVRCEKLRMGGDHENNASGALIVRNPISDYGKLRLTSCTTRNIRTFTSEMVEGRMESVSVEFDKVEGGLGGAIGDRMDGLEENSSIPMFRASLGPSEEAPDEELVREEDSQGRVLSPVL